MKASEALRYVRAKMAAEPSPASHINRPRRMRACLVVKDERGRPMRVKDPLQEKWERFLAACNLGLDRARVNSGGYDATLLDFLAHNVTERRKNEREYYLKRYGK